VQEPAISRSLRSAEQRAGFALVERRGRRLYLTASGLELANKARDVTEHLQEIDLLLRDMRSSLRGPLRVLVTPGPGNYVLPGILAAFLRTYPKVDIDLEIVSHTHIWRALVDEAYDVGIGPEPGIPTGLSGEHLYLDRLVVFAASGFSLDGRKRWQWDDLRDRTLLVGPFDEVRWQQALEDIGGRGFKPPKEMRVHAIEAVKQMAEAGAGLGVLFESGLWRELAEGRFVEVPISDLDVAVPYGMVRRPTRRPPPIIETFCSFVSREVTPLREAMAESKARLR